MFLSWLSRCKPDAKGLWALYGLGLAVCYSRNGCVMECLVSSSLLMSIRLIPGFAETPVRSYLSAVFVMFVLILLTHLFPFSPCG